MAKVAVGSLFEIFNVDNSMGIKFKIPCIKGNGEERSCTDLFQHSCWRIRIVVVVRNYLVAVKALRTTADHIQTKPNLFKTHRYNVKISCKRYSRLQKNEPSRSIFFVHSMEFFEYCRFDPFFLNTAQVQDDLFAIIRNQGCGGSVYIWGRDK